MSQLQIFIVAVLLVVFVGSLSYANAALLPLSPQSLIPSLCKFNNGTVIVKCNQLEDTFNLTHGKHVLIHEFPSNKTIWFDANNTVSGVNLGIHGFGIEAGNLDPQTLEFLKIVCGKGLTCFSNGTSIFINGTGGGGGGGITSINGDFTPAQTIQGQSGNVTVTTSGGVTTIGLGPNGFPANDYQSTYIVYKLGSIFYARNTVTLAITSNSDFAALINSIDSGGNVDIYVKRSVDSITQQINVKGSTRIMFEKGDNIGIPNGYTGNIFFLNDTLNRIIIDGGFFQELGSPKHLWDGIFIQSVTNGIYFNSFRGTEFYTPHVGIVLDQNGTLGWINSNYFNNIQITDPIRAVDFNQTKPWALGHSIDFNYFNDVTSQNLGSQISGFNNIIGQGNTFVDSVPFDLTGSSVSANIVFRGNDTTIIGGGMTEKNFVDNGFHTHIIDPTEGVYASVYTVKNTGSGGNPTFSSGHSSTGLDINSKWVFQQFFGTLENHLVSTSPGVNNSNIGSLFFDGKDSGGSSDSVINLNGFVSNATTPSVDGRLLLQVKENNAFNNWIDLNYKGQSRIDFEHVVNMTTKRIINLGLPVLPTDVQRVNELGLSPLSTNPICTTGQVYTMQANGTFICATPAGTGLSSTQNIGKGTGSSGVLAAPTSSIVRGKNMTAGSNISIQNNSTDITINAINTSQGNNLTSTNGAGFGIFEGRANATKLNFRTVTSNPTLTISTNTTNLLVNDTGTSPDSSFYHRTGAVSWYSQCYQNCVSSTGTVPVTNTTAAHPFLVGRGFGADRIEFEVTVGAAGRCALAIYNDDGTIHPGSLLVSGSDQSTASAATLKVDTISVNLKSQTLYWLAYNCNNNAATLRTLSGSTVAPILGWTGSAGAGQNIIGYQVAKLNPSSGFSFDDPFPTGSVLTNANMPLMMVRAK